MACFHPLEAWQGPGGRPVFSESRSEGGRLWLPCGKCIGCRIDRSRTWAVRCLHEAQMHQVNSFVTLTYRESETFDPSLNHRDFQLFMKRLRKSYGPTRYFMCGEYGSLNQRPHFHALLFGRTFSRGGAVSDSAYTSPELSKLWTLGFSSFGEVTYQSAAYVARYSQKKITGDAALAHYSRVDTRTGECVQVRPEYGRMSRDPSIGETWWNKYWKEVHIARDGIVLQGGRQVPVPRRYDELLRSYSDLLPASPFRDALLDAEYNRWTRREAFKEEFAPDRLAVREHCAKAKLKFYSKEKL